MEDAFVRLLIESTSKRLGGATKWPPGIVVAALGCEPSDRRSQHPLFARITQRNFACGLNTAPNGPAIVIAAVVGV